MCAGCLLLNRKEDLAALHFLCVLQVGNRDGFSGLKGEKGDPVSLTSL